MPGVGEGPPMSTRDQQMPAELVNPVPSVLQQTEVSTEQTANVGLIARLRRGLLGIFEDMKSGRAQKLNPHATPPIETPPQQSDSPQVREPSNP